MQSPIQHHAKLDKLGNRKVGKGGKSVVGENGGKKVCNQICKKVTNRILNLCDEDSTRTENGSGMAATVE
jgi:hypothetical protein